MSMKTKMRQSLISKYSLNKIKKKPTHIHNDPQTLNILDNVSLILPFYKKIEDFKYSLKNNYREFEKVNEVIIIFDHPIDNKEYNFLLEYKNINFRYFMNTFDHKWRNPVLTINFGIKQSKNDYVIIMSPETLLLENTLDYLIENTKNNYFSVGNIVFLNDKNYDPKNIDHIFTTVFRNENQIGPVYYGSICSKKSSLEKVGYYSHKFNSNGWGGDDDDIRIKLQNIGYRMKKIENAKCIHLEDETSFLKRLNRDFIKNKCHYPYDNFINIDINNTENIIINNDNIISSIKNYSFIDFKLRKKIKSYYPIVLLAQSYNEQNNVKKFLKNVSKFVDGIIILDDSSEDNTWELLKNYKLLLKFKKKRINFNDLENRNLLLNVVSNVFIKNNIQIDWFLWIDFDERLEYDNIYHIKDKLNTSKHNIYKLPLIHMWNEKEYNTTYPFSDKGIQYHIRLIRNILKKDDLPYVIKNKQNLHFTLNPYDEESYEFPLIIKHLGRNSEELRIEKYNLYTKIYDKTKIQKSYSHFIKKNHTLKLYDKQLLLLNVINTVNYE